MMLELRPICENCATDLRPDPLPQDDDEGIGEPIPMTLDEVYAALEDGRIADAKTLVALTLFERHRLAR